MPQLVEAPCLQDMTCTRTSPTMLLRHLYRTVTDYSAEDTVVPAKGKALIATDLSIACPPGTYGRIAPRSGLGIPFETWRLMLSGEEFH